MGSGYMRLVEHDPESGRCRYRAWVDLGEGRGLEFHVKAYMPDPRCGRLTEVCLEFDPYETSEGLHQAMARMGDWLQAASKVLRGLPQAGPPVRFEIDGDSG